MIGDFDLPKKFFPGKLVKGWLVDKVILWKLVLTGFEGIFFQLFNFEFTVFVLANEILNLDYFFVIALY